MSTPGTGNAADNPYVPAGEMVVAGHRGEQSCSTSGFRL